MPDFTRSLAVVIGIDHYQNGIPALQTACNDARAVAALLRDQHGYEPLLILDEEATLARLTALLNVDLPAQVGPDDRVFFYFAGHGVALNGDDGPQGFILPQDARRDSADSFLSMPDLHNALCALICRHLLAVLDCCFAGAFRWSSMRDIVSLPSVLHQERYDRFIRDPAWQVISSAAHDERALDVMLGRAIGSRGGAGEHSPFAEVLLEGLSGAGDVVPAGGGDGVITATELYVYLDDALAGETADRDHRQTPCLWPLKKHDKGQYIFLAPGHQLNLPPAPELSTANNPYRGLESFGEEHKDLFFGRDRVIRALVAHAAKQGLTVVAGASGTGKSSLVKAGLVPALRARSWEVLPIVRPGATPLNALATALASLNRTANGSEPSPLTPGLSALASQIDTWCTRHSGRILLLVIDQLEELVTICRDETEGDQFLQLLADAIEAQPNRLRVVLTVRSDFEPQFAGRSLEPVWRAARFVVPPMTQDELREAIEKPASERVLYFDPPALVDDLINEVVQTPGALPLLSFTLSEMYVRYLQRGGNDRSLTEADYEALGGVVGALRHRATEEFAGLDSAHQATMRRVMLRMVSLEGGEVARRRVPRSELLYLEEIENDRVRRVVDRLTTARLMVEGREPEGDPYVEPAHEELVRGWDKLWDWIGAERQRQDDLLFQRRLTQAATEWAKVADEKAQAGLLWQDSPRSGLLDQVLRSGQQWLNRTEAEFARRSVRRRRRNRRILTAGVAVIALTAVIATATAVLAIRQSHLAMARQLAAQARSYLNERLDLALLLSIEANRRSPTLEGWSSLLTAVQHRTALVAFLPGQRARVTALVFSQDGKTIASGSQDGTVCLWNVATRQALGPPLAGHRGEVSAVALTADGQTLASVGLDSTAILWDLSSREARPISLAGSEDRFKSVVFTPDDKTLAAGTERGNILLWDVDSRKGIPVPWMKHPSAVLALAFTPDQGILASAHESEAIVLWDLAKHQSIGEPIRRHALAVNSVVFSPDGTMLASASMDGQVGLWKLAPPYAREGLLPVQDHRPLLSAAFTPDGRTLAAIGLFGLVTVWDVSTHQELTVIPGQDGEVSSVAFAPDGRIVALGRPNGTVTLWTLPGGRIAAQRDSAGQVRIWSQAFSPDGAALASGYSDGLISIRDVVTGRRLQPSLHGSPNGVISLAFSGEGKMIAAGGKDSMVVLWDAATHQRLDPPLRTPAGTVSSLAFSPDGKLLATASNSWIAFWDVSSRRLLGKPRRRHEGGVLTLAFSPDGEMLASGGFDNSVLFWDVKRRWPLGRPTPGHDGPVETVAFSPDGKLLASGGDDHRVIFWDVATQQRLRGSLPRQGGQVYSLAFSPDGKTLVAGSSDNAGVIWDVRTRQPLEPPLVGPEDRVSAVGYSLEGSTVAAADLSGGIYSWGIGLDSWRRQACNKANRNMNLDEWERFMAGRRYHTTCPDLPPGEGAPGGS